MIKIKHTYVEHKDRAERIQSAVTAIKAIVPLGLYPEHKKYLISICIWKITEADGKYNLIYRSEGVVNNQGDKIQHEHVNERKYLVERLLLGEEVEFVIKDAISCLVTEEEHKRLGISSSRGWQRYKEIGIRVYDAKENRWLWE